MSETKDEDTRDPRFAAIGDMAGKVIQKVAMLDGGLDHPRLVIHTPADVIAIRFNDIDSEVFAFRISAGVPRGVGIPGASGARNLELDRFLEFMNTPKPVTIDVIGVDRPQLEDRELWERFGEVEPIRTHERIKYLFHKIWTDYGSGYPYDKKLWSELSGLLRSIGLSV